MTRSDQTARPLAANLAYILAACIFFIAIFPTGPVFATLASVGLVLATCAGLLALSWAGSRPEFGLRLDVSSLRPIDIGIIAAMVALLSLMAWPLLRADLWSDAVYHASLAAQVPQLLLLKLQQTKPDLWSALEGMKGAHLVQVFSLAVMSWLAILFGLIPLWLRRWPFILGGVWIGALLLTRALFSTDIGMLSGTENLPVLLANPANQDAHPPLRLLPLLMSSAFFGASSFGYRLAAFAGLLAMMVGYYLAFRLRTGRTLAALGAIAIASLPGLLQTASVVESSLWTALGGWAIFAALAAADRADRPLNLIPFAFAFALAAMMRAPAFIVLVPLVLLMLLEVSRRPIGRVELGGTIALTILGLSASIVFIVFGTPAISGASPLQQLHSALVEGAPAVALVTVIGLPPLLLIGFALSQRGAHGLMLAAATVGYLIVSVAVFYGPTRSVLWGIPRYQAEIAVPLIAAGITTLIVLASAQPHSIQFRGRTILPGITDRVLPLTILAGVIAANLFAVANIYNTKSSYLSHPIPRQSVAADAPFEFRRAFDAARQASPGKQPYHIGIWYGGFQAILSGSTVEEYAAFSQMNVRHRSGWNVDLDALTEDTEIGSLVVEPEMDFGAIRYFNTLGWDQLTITHPVSGNALLVFKRPDGSDGIISLRYSMPEPSAAMASLVGSSSASYDTAKLLECRSFLDGVTFRYSAPKKGVRVSGWGWHGNDNRPFDLVIATDAAGNIVGASDTRIDRPDVRAAFPQLQQSLVGFDMNLPVESGTVTILGVDQENQASCDIANGVELGEVVVPD